MTLEEVPMRFECGDAVVLADGRRGTLTHGMFPESLAQWVPGLKDLAHTLTTAQRRQFYQQAFLRDLTAALRAEPA